MKQLASLVKFSELWMNMRWTSVGKPLWLLSDGSVVWQSYEWYCCFMRTWHLAVVSICVHRASERGPGYRQREQKQEGMNSQRPREAPVLSILQDGLHVRCCYKRSFLGIIVYLWSLKIYVVTFPMIAVWWHKFVGCLLQPLCPWTGYGVGFPVTGQNYDLNYHNNANDFHGGRRPNLD